MAADGQILRIDGEAVADASGFLARPGALIVRIGRAAGGGPTLRLLAAGRPGEVSDHPANVNAIRVHRPGAVLVPGLVNVHAHLDLTHIGPRPYDPAGGFSGFADIVRAGRRSGASEIADSVVQGIQLLLAGGTAVVGDIAGAVGGRPSPLAGSALAEAAEPKGLSGVSYVEFFALGAGRQRAVAAALETLDDLPDRGGIRFGLQPHAPYSVAPDAYATAAEGAVQRGVPWCTHLAESPQEHELIETGGGPLRAFLQRIGVWDDQCSTMVGKGQTPVAHLRPTLAWLCGALRAAERGLPPPMAVHVNDAADADIAILAGCGASVAYCPRASAYFGAERDFGPHRYRDMLAAGINVCLGTDSIINLPSAAADAASGGISILDEMRLLFRRDATDPRTLLSMATINGAAALGIDPSAFLFGSVPGVTRPVTGGRPTAGVVAVPSEPGAGDPLRTMLCGHGKAELLAIGLV